MSFGLSTTAGAKRGMREDEVQHERVVREGVLLADGRPRSDEGFFRMMVDAIHDYAIFALDAQGFVMSWNPGAERITGYRAEEIVGRHFSRFYTPADAEAGRPARELELAATRGRYEEEGIRVRKDGSQFWSGVVVTPLRDGEGRLLGFAKVTRDITERKLAEEDLRRSEERFRLLVESVQDYGIFMLDTEGRIASWNLGAERIKGYRAEEIIGQHFSRFYTEEDVAAGKPARELVVAVAEGRYAEEGWRVRKDGTLFWASIVITALRDETGRLRGFAKVTRDMTERREVEEQLRRLNEELEQRVAERTAQLEAANKELEAFSYSVSHDLRAPLRGIDGFSQALLEDYGDKLDEQGLDYLRRVRAATQRMSRLIDDLLNLSRITRGELRREAVDLSGLAGSVAEQLRQAEPERLVEFRFAEGVTAQGDPRLLRIALENLLGNAWKFTARTADAVIEFGATREGVEDVYFVRDNGAGFDMAYAGKLFGAFQRLHDVREFEGTGIGLATVQRIVRRHGGRVWAEGEPGRGATFYFTL